MIKMHKFLKIGSTIRLTRKGKQAIPDFNLGIITFIEKEEDEFPYRIRKNGCSTWAKADEIYPNEKIQINLGVWE